MEISKTNVQVLDVIARNDVKAILSDCNGSALQNVSNRRDRWIEEINDVIARRYSVAGSGVVRITDDQITALLTMPSREVSLKLHLPVTEIRKCASE